MEMEFKPDEQSICDMVYHAVHKAVSKLSSVSSTDKTKQPPQKNPKAVIKIRPTVKIGTNTDRRQARMPIPHLWQWPNKRDKADETAKTFHVTFSDGLSPSVSCPRHPQQSKNRKGCGNGPRK